MKEFSAQTGGRYTYSDDLENLQDLALAFGELFDDCDAFVVSGCEVSGSAINAGYIYLNGKLRYFSGATGVTSWPQYVYEKNYTENVAYVDSEGKVGRNVYGCAYGSSIPSTTDALTGKIPAAIKFTASGATLMKDAFIGKYALLLSAAASSQTVNGPVQFSGQVSLSALLKATQGLQIGSGSYEGKLAYEGGNLILQSKTTSNTYRLLLNDGGGLQFYINGTLKATIADSAITFAVPFSSTQGTLGGVTINSNGIYQSTSTLDTGTLNINMAGYNGTATKYRTTVIGNGKGVAILTLTGGSTNKAAIAGNLTIDNTSNTIETLVLQGPYASSSVNQRNAIVFKDNAASAVGYVGFTSTSDKRLYITCSIADVQITGSTKVNIGPKIAENGTLLEDKYVQVTTYNDAMALKADAADYYTKTYSDARYATLHGTFTQFINAGYSAATLRNQIGAVSTSDLASYAKLTSYLSDMATSDTAKQTIRTNIGAVSKADVESMIKVTDSGWVKCSTQNSSDAIYARQIGNVVSVQGTVKLIHSGTIITIPNTIGAPTHDVICTLALKNNRSWSCGMTANTRSVNVIYCDSSCGTTTKFTFQYMI